MKIVEIFPTIQGEGPGLGKPSVFVRFGGCNLRCQFKGEACDTPYAVFTPPQLKKKNERLMFGYNQWFNIDHDALINTIKSYNINNIVFTGGEPMLYQEEIGKLIYSLGIGYTSEIETNGTIVNHILWPNVTFNVSVKLSSSNQEKGYDLKRINPLALKSYPCKHSVYKFVITDKQKDLKEINQILSIHRLPVYVMPQGLTREEVLKNSEEVIQLAIENNFIFTPREHINVYDSKKGV